MTRYRADLALLAVALVWGSSYLATKEATRADGALAFLAVRFGLAACLLAALLGRRLTRIGRAELICGILFGAILAAICACETYGVTRTSASNAGLIMAFTIVLIPLLGGAAGLFYVPAIVVMLGCVLLTQSGGFAPPGAGDALMVAAAVLRAVHITVMSRCGGTVDPAAVTLVQLATVAVLTAVPAGVLGQFDTLTTMSATQWVLTVYLAMACTVFAFVVQMWAVRRSAPARIAVLLGTEPLWAMLIGIGLAAEPVTAAGMLGAVLILGGTQWGRSVQRHSFDRTHRDDPHRSGAGR